MEHGQTLNALLIDDDALCLEALQDTLSLFDDVCIVGSLTNSTDAVAFLRQNQVHLVFLDIEMDRVGGFELARHLRHHHPEVQIVFQTGHASYAVDGYEFQPADFLVKPITAMKMERALMHVRENLSRKVTEIPAQIGIRTGSGLSIINVADILYVEKTGRKVYIVCKDDERILTNYSIQNLQGILEEYDFVRNHQSYLVPLHRIKKIEPDGLNGRTYRLLLDGYDTWLPLSRERLEGIKKQLLLCQERKE